MIEKTRNYIGQHWNLTTAFILVLAAIWIGVSAAPPGSTTQGAIPAPKEGFLAPEFSLETLAGGRITLNELRGQVIVLNLWASWCPPCRAEMPAMQAVYETYRDQGLVILAINATNQDSLSAAQAFVEENQLDFPILLDLQGEVSTRYQLRSLPSTYFIDRQGMIQEIVIGGPMSETLIETKIAALLEAKP